MKKLFFAFAAFAALVSCVRENGLENQPQDNQVSIMATAGDTKTTLDGNLVKWVAGDAIALRFAKGEDVYTETFTTAGSGVEATFTGILDNEVNVANGYAEMGYAVYPGTAMDIDGNVSFTLPESVTALENGSFADGANLSSARVSLADLNDFGTTSAAFKNAFSIIRFTLGADIVSLKITADGELAGQATMTFDDEGRLEVGSWNSGKTSVMVTPEGETFTAAKTYNVLVYPGTFSSITVLLTDADGCVYEKTLESEFVFAPSEYYTFTFNTKFEKEYYFKGTGRTFVAGNMVATAYFQDETLLHDEVLTADAALKFRGNLPSSVVHGEGVTGYAIYPSTAYNAGNISYTLPADGSAKPELWSAALEVGDTLVAFTNVDNALSTLSFNLPAGIKTVNISASKGIVGTAAMTVVDGQLVAGEGNGKVVELAINGVAGTWSVPVFPVKGTSFVFTFTDMADETAVQEVPATDFPAGGVGGVTVGGLTFDKNGSFTNENFTEGGSYEF